MSTTKPCAQTSLATDNTPLECEEFISSACVIHPDALVELSLPEDSTVQDIINAFLNAIINLNNQIGTENSSVVSGEVVGTDIVLTKSDTSTVIIDASAFFDDTNLARITSGAVVGTDLVLTRDDATDVTVDVSALLDDTNLARVVSGAVVGSDLILTRDDATDITIDVTTLLDDTNLARVVSGAVVGTDLILTRDDVSTITIDVTSLIGGGGGGVVSVNSGNQINVDNTDPANPIVNVQGQNSVSVLAIGTTFNDLFNTVPANVSVNFSQIGNIVHYEGFIACQRNTLLVGTPYTAIFNITLPIPVTSARAVGNVFCDGLTLQPAIQQHCSADTPNTLTITVRVYNAVAQGTGSATIFFTGTYRTP